MDGSGKTTQIQRLAARLRGLGRTVLETAEPGGTPIGMKIRRILLDAANQELSPITEVLLYFASRSQNVDEWIASSLDRGEVVLADRFTDSSLVYQGCGRNLGEPTIVRASNASPAAASSPISRCWWTSTAETSLARARARTWRIPTAKPAWTTKLRITQVYQAYPRAGRTRAGARQGGRWPRRCRRHRAPGLEHRRRLCLTTSAATGTPPSPGVRHYEDRLAKTTASRRASKSRG